ncbi:ImmA/IrrE family metallo-endopeptidase [Methanoplanus limicola]|nr:ImmA/IrrE family metallo-endopeptidase [Methanoplanus limicola]
MKPDEEREMETIIKGEMIKWARERAGLSIEELAEKLKTNTDKVKKWESGELAITVAKARSLSKISLVPYGLLFADNPPEDELPIADFRTHGLEDIIIPSAELLETISDARLKQEWYRDYLIAEDSEPLKYIGKYDINSDPELTAKNIKKILRIDEDEYLKCRDWERAFGYLLNHAEDAGITVIVNSSLKNNTRRPLDEEEFRGFVLSDRYAPIIFINGRDAKPARTFTLIHEIAHLLIGVSGVLDNTLEINHSVPQERWCNQVAAEFLTPKERFISIWNKKESIDKNLDNIRLRLKVSRLVCVYRAYQLNLISCDEKQKLYSEEITRIEAMKEKRREEHGGPDPYLLRRFKTGRNLALAVISEVNSNRMLYRDAFRLLGIRNAESLKEFSGRLGY